VVEDKTETTRVILVQQQALVQVAAAVVELVQVAVAELMVMQVQMAS
jgi:hypothetical protein